MEQLKPIHLPIELVLNIITCSLPKPNVLLAPAHPITQLLLTFTLVCKETQKLATKYLCQHCVYITSEARLDSFLHTAIPARHEFNNISALFLAPFGETIDDLSTATCVRNLLNHTCKTLKRLIIDIPLRSLYPEDDNHGVRNILREGFLHLENLEEFVSVRDELFLRIDDDYNNREPCFWRHFPKLRRLAVYNPMVNSEFWVDVAAMQNLECIVLTRADGLRDRDGSNFKTEYFRHCDRPLKVLLVNTDTQQVRYVNMRRQRWDDVDPMKKMTIMTYSIPLVFDDDPAEVCQYYVRMGAEYGTVWNWEGEVIQHRPRFVQQVSSGA